MSDEMRELPDEITEDQAVKILLQGYAADPDTHDHHKKMRHAAKSLLAVQGAYAAMSSVREVNSLIPAAVLEDIKYAVEVLGDISRMRTMPDHKTNTFTLVCAHRLALQALQRLSKYGQSERVDV